METTPEQAAEGMALVRVLAGVLDRLVCANAPLSRADPGQITKFHALKAPGIAIQQYLERIHKYASCSNECFILALIYIDRLIQRNNFLLTELNVHRVVITAILLAAKFFDDAYYNNAYYAKVGGVLVSEMNGLEVDFLFRINFSLHVTPELFSKYHAELASHSDTGAGVSQSELRIPSLPNSCQTSPHLQASVAVVPTTHVVAPQNDTNHLLHHTDHGVQQQQTYPVTNRQPTHITPSPPPPQHQPAVPAAPQGYSEENVIMSGDSSFQMLQRHNSGPACLSSNSSVQGYPVRCSPHGASYNSAPATVSITQSHTPEYLVVDHSAYAVHGVGANNYHHPGHHDATKQQVPHGQALTQHYVGGQMLAGVTRGF
mmetsp:Transcript_379/g.522  ORF Transcript_379/g.522 Transcript_379/m.522 type:complete len:373 (-) Transcript_379:270-1388(-)